MRKAPLLDPRTKEDIVREIREKSLVYTPEWRYSGEAEDAGGALVRLFSDLFFETVDRFNRVPHKNYIAFLNLLDVRRNPVLAARGTVRFAANTSDGSAVHVPKGTQVYASEAGDEEGVPVFETEHAIYALPGEILAAYTADPVTDCIEEQDFAAGAVALLHPNLSRNLQSHRFALGHRGVCALREPCIFELRLEHSESYYTPAAVDALTNPAIAQWTYFDGEEEAPFDAVEEKAGAILLKKSARRPIAAVDGDGAALPAIVCRVLVPPQDLPDLRVRTLSIRSSLLEGPCAPEAVYANEDPIELTFGGYCFGRRPVQYDCFYLCSREIFSKAGAQINLQLHVTTVLEEQLTPENQYEFSKKYIIDKDAVKRTVPDIFVSAVVWEYWNGLGWSALSVEGDANPFSCKEDGEKHVRFTCPEDVAPFVVNGVESRFIRARVAFVEHAFDPTGRFLIPHLARAALTYEYPTLQPIEYIESENNRARFVLADAARISALNAPLYAPLPFENTACYLAFEHPPIGYPISLHFELECTDGRERTLEYQVWTAGGFATLRTLDGTEDLKRSGTVCLFISETPEKRELFGLEAYWLRVLDAGSRYQERDHSRLRIRAITTNAVPVIQRQTAPEEFFDAGLFEANKTIVLVNTPVLDCEVWVNEWGTLPPEALEALAEETPGVVEVERDAEGEVAACYVRWERVPAFLQSDRESRYYMLDSMRGEITFGDGQNGRPPCPGDQSIRVRYAYGGGARGNLPAGALDALMTSIPNIAEVRNFLPTAGGSDLQSLETIERLGPTRLKHRGRALTAEDYEHIVLEQFGQVRDVRCFAGVNPAGERAPGELTLVVMGQEYENPSYALLLAEQVYEALKTRADLQVIEGGLLHVIPAQVMRISVSVKLHLSDFNQAALAEKSARKALSAMIAEKRVHGHTIGNLPGKADVYAALKGLPHIRSAQDVLLEGRFYQEGKERLVSLDDGGAAWPFAAAESGTHRIKF